MNVGAADDRIFLCLEGGSATAEGTAALLALGADPAVEGLVRSISDPSKK